MTSLGVLISTCDGKEPERNAQKEQPSLTRMDLKVALSSISWYFQVGIPKGSKVKGVNGDLIKDFCAFIEAPSGKRMSYNGFDLNPLKKIGTITDKADRRRFSFFDLDKHQWSVAVYNADARKTSPARIAKLYLSKDLKYALYIVKAVKKPASPNKRNDVNKKAEPTVLP